MPVGQIHTPYKTLQDCPRASEAGGPHCTILLDARFGEALDDIEAASHLHVIYLLDKAPRETLRSKTCRDGVVRGVFANRAPSRPNPLGLSVVRLIGRKGLELTVSNLDCLDGTLLVDLKPYLPDRDNVSGATLNWKKA